MITAETDNLANSGSTMDVSTDQLAQRLTQEEQEFRGFLDQLGVDVSSLTQEEIQKLLSLKKAIDTKFLKIKTQQEAIFVQAEHPLNEAHKRLQAQENAVRAYSAAIIKKISDYDWYLDSLRNKTVYTAEDITAATEDEKALQEVLVDRKATLEQALNSVNEATLEAEEQ